MIAKILEATAKEYNVTKEQILSRQRTKDIAEARKIAQLIMFQRAKMNMVDIAKYFGRCHSAVSYNITTIGYQIEHNSQIRQRYNTIKSKL